jgi:FkbM family methyltransferase
MRLRLFPSGMRSAAKTVRDVPTVSRLLSSLARPFISDPPPEWFVKHLPRQGTVVVDVPGVGTVRFWSRADDYITSRVWWMGMAGYERETVVPFLRFVKEASVVVDVGAYTGYYSILAAAANPRTRVFAFEPHPRIAARLGRNLDLNQNLTVTVLPFAVGAERGSTIFHIGGPGLPSSSSLDPRWEGLCRSIPVASIDLDSFTEDWGIEHVDLIKIDVESTEQAVVAGMQRILARDRPVIFLEVLPQDSATELSTRLLALDYKLYYLRCDGPREEAVLASTDPLIDHAHTPFNHLACPAEKVPTWLL